MRIERLQKIDLLNTDMVKVTRMGNVTEVMYSQKKSKGGYITKVDNDHYVDNRTGELCEFKHIENRAQDLQNVSKTLKTVRDLLNTNITDVKKCRWVTLTYAENMCDTKRLYHDFKKFWLRFKYYLKKQFGIKNVDYISVAEPQGRGAWHLHLVFIFGQIAPFIPNVDLARLWGQGFVKIKKLDDVDNVGAYLTAYLGDMCLEDWQEAHPRGRWVGDTTTKVIDGKEKKILKGARLHMYPAKFNMYRCSRGIKKPTAEYMDYEQSQKIVDGQALTYTKTLSLEDDESDYTNVLQYMYYNAKRKVVDVVRGCCQMSGYAFSVGGRLTARRTASAT